jgi:DNA adenine methylase
MAKNLSFFPYIGGKGLLTNTITKLIPEHRIYVEVFGGSAKVLLNKKPSEIEVYNDADLRLSNLFYVIAFKFPEFEEKVNRLVFSRALHEKFLGELNLKQLSIKELGDVELAVKTYFILRSSFSGQVRNGSFRVSYTRPENKTFFNSLEDLEAIHNRLKNVVVECLGFDKLLENYSDREDTFIYLDPPYFGAEGYYDTKFTLEDHKKLLNLLKNSKAKWLLSGYANELYDTELKDFYRLEIPSFKPSYSITKHNKHITNERPKSTEILWANYKIKL